MTSKNLTGYLIDVLDDMSGPITISNTLDALYPYGQNAFSWKG